MEDEKTLTNINGLDSTDVITIKKLTYGESTDLEGHSTKLDIEVINGKPIPKPTFDMALFKRYLLCYSIKSIKSNHIILREWNEYNDKPNTSTIIQRKINIINRFPRELGVFLFNECNIFNGDKNNGDDIKKD